MQILRKSQFTGKNHMMEINITPVQYEAYLNDPNRPLIQKAFPNLTADEREFLMTGATPGEWNEMFSPKK